jgi:hypothetical protein
MNIQARNLKSFGRIWRVLVAAAFAVGLLASPQTGAQAVGEERFHAEIVENDVAAFDWPAGAGLTLSIYDYEGGSQLYTAYETADAAGFALFDGFPTGAAKLQLAEGMYITVNGYIPDLGASITKTHTIRQLQVTGVNLRTDAVGGTGVEDDELNVQYCDDTGCVRRFVTVVDGGWTADFSVPVGAGTPEEAATLDIDSSMVGEVLWGDDDGDQTDVQWRSTQIVAPVTPNFVRAWGWPAGKWLELSIGNPVVFTQTALAEPWPDDPTQTWATFDLDDDNDGAADWTLQAGDELKVWDMPGKGFERHLTVSTLSVTGIDTGSEVETVSGTVESGQDVDVDANTCASGCPAYRHVTASGTGWAADFHVAGDQPPEEDGTANLEAGSAGTAWTYDWDGDRTTVDWYVFDPHFEVRANDDYMEIWDYPLGHTVDIDIDDPATPSSVDAEASVVMEADPWDLTGTWAESIFDAFDIQPGMTVTTSDASSPTGDPIKTHVVTPLQIKEWDPALDSFGGLATDDAVVHANVCRQGEGCVGRVVTAEGDGNWSVDFTNETAPGAGDAWDIEWGDWLDSHEIDAENDSTGFGLTINQPSITVRPNTDTVEGYSWTLGATVTLFVDEVQKAQAVVGVDEWDPSQTYVVFELGGISNIIPGMTIRLAEGEFSKSTYVRSVQITARGWDVGANTFWGTAQPYVTISGNACGDGNCSSPLETTADGDGEWLIDLDDLDVPWDLVAGDWIDAHQGEGDGDETAWGVGIPIPSITVRANDDWIEAYNWTLGSSVNLYIDSVVHPDGPFTVVAADWDPNETYVSMDAAPFDIVPGTVVSVTDGVTTKTHTATGVRIDAYNLVANIIGGTADPGDFVWVNACNGGPCPGKEVQADVLGNWWVDMDDVGWDLDYDDWIDAHEYESDGDETAYGMIIRHPWFAARPNNNIIEAFRFPMGWGVTFILDKYPQDGNPECELTQDVSEWTPWGSGETYLVFDPALCAVPQQLEWRDSVLLSDLSTAKQHTVTDLELTGYDMAADTFHGRAEIGSVVVTRVCNNETCESINVGTNGYGDWYANYSGVADISPGDWLDSQQFDPDQDSTGSGVQLANPTFSARLPWNEVHGYGWEIGVPVAMSIEGGVMPYSDTAIPVVADWDPDETFVRFEIQDFELQEGQLVTLTQGDIIKQHGVRKIAVTSMNFLADTMSGSISYDAMVEIDANCDSTGCQAHRDHHSDGDSLWTADFVNPGPDSDEQTTANLTVASEGEVRSPDDDGDFTAWEWQGAPFISGNAGDDGVVLTWFDGTTKTYTTGGAGNYYISVPFGWDGTITPSKAGLAFGPVSRTYTNASAFYGNQDFALFSPTRYPDADLTQVCRRPRVGVELDVTDLMRLPNGAFNPASFTLIVNSVNVTSQATVATNHTQPVSTAKILYTPTADLPLGPRSASITFPVAASPGTTTYVWNFTVANIPCTSLMSTEVTSSDIPPATLKLASTDAAAVKPVYVSGRLSLQNPYRRSLLRR